MAQKQKSKRVVGEDGFLPETEAPTSVWLPGMRLEEGEELECDPSAYKMLHTLETPWPCLSFDVVRDAFGDDRTAFPLQCTLVAGTTTPHPTGAQLMLLHCHDLQRTGGYSTDSEDEDEDDEDEDDEEDKEEDNGMDMKKRMVQPKQDVVFAVDHPGNVNRVRAHQRLGGPWIATFSDRHRVHVWQGATMVYETPKRTGHRAEGFGLAWHPRHLALLSGDSQGHVLLHSEHGGGAFSITSAFAKTTGGGIEDINWSPTSEHAFATVGTDGHLRLWDARVQACQSSTLMARCDVNVLSWSAVDDSLIALGAEDGSLQVVDVRKLGGEASGCVLHANTSWHTAAITSVEWHPTDASIMAASGDDDQTSVWAWGAEAVEPQDDLRNSNVRDLKRVAPDLLFVHAGQQEVRELHWHAQCPGLLITTAATGFNLFRTVNL